MLTYIFRRKMTKDESRNPKSGKSGKRVFEKWENSRKVGKSSWMPNFQKWENFQKACKVHALFIYCSRFVQLIFALIYHKFSKLSYKSGKI